MPALAIKFADSSSQTCCAYCGHAIRSSHGLDLFQVEPAGRVCDDCGRRHAPHLAALLSLARTAERVGKVCRHLIVPPMASLLDLARAAEDFTYHAPKSPKRLEKVA
jgi:hypothetical protein